jgi:hypothetical protein
VTWTINIGGHDDLTGDEKIAYEEDVVAKAKALAQELAGKEGGHVSSASATTNTTGSVNLLSE